MMIDATFIRDDNIDCSLEDTGIYILYSIVVISCWKVYDIVSKFVKPIPVFMKSGKEGVNKTY